MLWLGDQGKKAEENCFLRDPGGLAPSPVFLKDGSIKSDFADFAGFHALFADLCAAGAKAGGLP